jgi:hypothetical protein
MRGWLVAGAVCLLSCAPADTGTGAKTTVQHALSIHVSGTGAGTVGSSSGFTCAAQCRQPVDSTTSLRLTAVPATGSTFKGWQGTCSGTATCDLSMDGDRDVTAVFDVEERPVEPGRISVGMVGSGSGRIVSIPEGIDCPAVSCSVALQKGTTVSLTAQPDARSTFIGWGGACTGPGACSVNANGDLTVWANFGSPVSNPPPPPPPPPPQCAGLGPPTPAAPLSVTTFTPGTCAPGMADDEGILGLQSFAPGRIALHIVDPANARERGVAEYSIDRGGFMPMADGFTGMLWLSNGQNQFSAHHWDSHGKYVSASQMLQGQPAFNSAGTGGAILISGDFSWSGWPSRHQAFTLSQDGAFLWAADLASRGTVFGLGFDLDHDALLITDGGDGHAITAQWFSSSGTALTGEFVLLPTFAPGANTWFETAALIGGGLAVRRVDQFDDADGRPYRTAQWLVTVGSGMASTQAAPVWLVDRPNTNLVLARRGKAYAVLPLGGPGADCAQKIEVLATDGASCGSFDVTVARGQCRTEDMGLGRDGTPIQLMPKALAAANTCSYRWWPAALR